MEQQIGSFEEADKYLAKNRITSFEDADKLFASQTEAKLPPGPDQASRNMADAGELTTPKTLSRKYVAPFVQPVLTGVGGGLGAAAGSPLGPIGMAGGGFSGGMLGNVVSQYLQNQAPGYFGESGSDPNSSVDQLTHAAKESAYQESGGMAIGAGINAARNLPELIRAGKPLFNRASETAKAALSINPAESDEQLARQAANSARDRFTNVSDQFDKSASSLASKANSAPSNYYREIAPDPNAPKTITKNASGQTTFVAPKPTYEIIKAPIPIDKTQMVASSMYKRLEKSLSDAPIADRDVKSVMNNLRTLVDEEPATNKMGVSHGIPVTEFYKVDRLRNSITNYLSKHPSGTTVAPDPVVDNLIDLNLKLSEDMDNGLQQWGNKAYANYAERQNLQIQKANIANSPLSQKLLTLGVDPQTTYETVAKDALKDISSARQFVTTTADRPTLMKMAQRQLIEKTSDPTTGILDPQKALNELNTNPVYSAAIPSQALSHTKELMKALASNQNNAFANRVRGITIGHGGIGLGLSPFVLHATTGLPYAASVGALAGAKLIGMSIDKLMANPTTARAVIQMAKTPIGSPLVKTLSRVIFSGLKGESNLQVVDDKGNTFDAQINNQGNLVVH